MLEKLRLVNHHPRRGPIELLKYIGPGLLVTVGFIDPGNWASNVAAGSGFGYTLLWMVTLSTIMLIILQHNVAHLGIVTGLCLSEATEKYLPRWFGRPVLWSAVLASISTALAEILGGAIGLRMLFRLPLQVGAVLVGAFIFLMLFTKSYRKLEKVIIGFVSLIGLSFLFELIVIHQLPWSHIGAGWIIPLIPMGSIPIVMSVLGAVVMPHNLFLHSEIIQSRQWNLADETVIKRQLNYEFLDTLVSMLVGWGINSAMIIVAAAVLFRPGHMVDNIEVAQRMLQPLLGNIAAVVFALALLFSGLASSVTAGMAGGSIYAGISGEPYDPKDSHTRWGIIITVVGAIIIVFLIRNPFGGLIISQILLSVQLPWTIFAQIRLTSSRRVMGSHANSRLLNITLWTVAAVVSGLNLMLLWSLIHP